MAVYDYTTPLLSDNNTPLWDADFALVWDNYGNTQTQEYNKYTSQSAGEFVTPIVSQTKTFSSSIVQDGLHNGYYGLIHVSPEKYDLSTFDYGNSYTFDIWNAVLSPGGNNLNSITEVGSPGISLDVAPPVFFEAGEYKSNYGATITTQARFQSETTFTFNFDVGSDTFEFIIRSNPLFNLKPDKVFDEAIEYKTDIITKHNGKEQRITTRINPKRAYNFGIVFKDYDDIREYKRILFSTYPNVLLLPLYNSRTYLSSDVSVDDTIIYGDFSNIDLRVGGQLLVEDVSEVNNEVVEVKTFTTSQVTLVNKFVSSFSAGANVFLVENVYLKNNQSASIARVNTGVAKLSLTQSTMPPLLGTGATINTYDSLPLMDKIPYSAGEDAHAIGVNIENLSTQNYTKFASSDLHAYETFSLKYKISSRAEQQFWYKFIDGIKGANKPFLIPTKRDDLSPISPALVSQITVTNSGLYGNTYADIEAYDRLQLSTAAGIQNVTVTNVSILGNGNVELDFTPSLANDPDWLDVQKIHFLNKVRLLGDRVVFKHYSLYSTVDLKVRTVVQ